AIAPDGHLITLDDDQVIRHWDAARHPARTEDLIHKGDPSGQTLSPDFYRRGVLLSGLRRGDSSGQTLSPDGRTLAVVLRGGRVQLIDVATGGETHVLRVTPPVLSLAFAPGGRMLIVAGGDWRAQVWEVAAPPREVTHTRLPIVPSTNW